MTFDETSRRVILFGGKDSNAPDTYGLDDTWAWDGSTWTELDPCCRDYPFPKPRENAALAYFPPGRYSLLFGGDSLGDTFNDSAGLYLSTSDDWNVFGVDSPGALTDSAIAYYPITQKILLFGGRDSNQLGTNLTATWSNGWSILNLLKPPPTHRSGARLAYSLNNGRLVLFGGLSGDNNKDFGDTWTWGRQVACLPGNDSTLHVGTTVRCFFQEETDEHFGYWITDGFAPNSTNTLNKTFHTNGPGPASITAVWFDGAGQHTETFHFTIERPHQ